MKIVDRWTDMAGKTRVLVEMGGYAIPMKYDKAPDDATILADAEKIDTDNKAREAEMAKEQTPEAQLARVQKEIVVLESQKSTLTAAIAKGSIGGATIKG